MNDPSTKAEPSDRTRRRRAYESPAITDFGDVEKLTRAVSGYV